MNGVALRLTAALPVLLMTAIASAAEPAPWPDNFVGRLEALALLESLNADLLAHDSATLTIERWCAEHRLANPARIVAERVSDAAKPASAEVREALDVKPDEPLGYRRVQLKCGDHVLSEADNWYVPARLTPEMNHALETTDTPFGKAVAALHFRRHTLSADLLWRPLPIPDHVLEHRAVLSTPDGEPFSEVVETYTGEVLAFPPPK
jgi:chorismate-pyruvate lyase